MIFAKYKVIFLITLKFTTLKWQHIKIILDIKHSQHELF